MLSAPSLAAPRPGLRSALSHALRPTILARSVAASVIMWLIMGSVSPSYSSLIFQDELAVYFAAGLGIAPVSNIVVVVLTSLFSSDHTTISHPHVAAAIQVLITRVLSDRLSNSNRLIEELMG